MANPAAVVKATFVDQIPTKVIDNGSCGEPVNHNEPAAQPPAPAPALSSLDIAEVTGEEHSRILELIQRFMGRRGLNSVSFAFEAETKDGQRCAVYELPWAVFGTFLLGCDELNLDQKKAAMVKFWKGRLWNQNVCLATAAKLERILKNQVAKVADTLRNQEAPPGGRFDPKWVTEEEDKAFLDDIVRNQEGTQPTAWATESDDLAFLAKVDEIVRSQEAPAPLVVPAVDLGRVPVFYPSPETGGPVKTMSSLEIAELTGKRHDNVLSDIQRILGEAEIDALKFKGVYRGGNGESRPCYHLPRFECDLVISGYSVPYRKAIIKRWHELEAKALAEANARIEQKPEEPDYPALLRQASDMLLRAATRLEEQKPKVEFYDRYVETTRLSGIKETAQALSRWTTFVRGRNKFSESPPYCRIPHR
jgi:phage regulator Rha-like protein